MSPCISHSPISGHLGFTVICCSLWNTTHLYSVLFNCIHLGVGLPGPYIAQFPISEGLANHSPECSKHISLQQSLGGCFPSLYSSQSFLAFFGLNMVENPKKAMSPFSQNTHKYFWQFLGLAGWA